MPGTHSTGLFFLGDPVHSQGSFLILLCSHRYTLTVSSLVIRYTLTDPSRVVFLLIDRPSIFSHLADPSFTATHADPLWLSVTRCHCHCRFDIIIPGIISNKCWIKRPACLMKQFSLLEIISAATVLLAMVVESSRVFHVVG